jgi:hypothetical protein
MQRIHDPLHGVFEIGVGLLIGGRLDVRIGEIGDQDVDMPDFSDDPVSHFGLCQVPRLRKEPPPHETD